MTFKKIVKFILAWCVNNIFYLYSGVMLLLPSIVLIYKKIAGSVSWITILLGVALLLQSSIVIGIGIWKKKAYKSYSYPKRMLKYEFICLEKIITVRRCRGYALEYVNEWKIKAAKDNPQITIKYKWSGEGSPEFEMIEGIDSCSPITSIGGAGSNTTLLVPNVTLKKGDVHVIKFKLKIADERTGEPFITTTVYEPTKKVVLNLDFNKSYKGKKVTFRTFRSGDNIEIRHAIDCKEYTFDKFGQVSATIKPQRFRLLMLRW